MLITLDLTEPMVANSALDATIYSQTKTELTFTVQNPQGADLEGFSCVLLSTDGKTLAHSIISSNKAVLDTNTVECIEYVSSLQVDAKTAGYLVIGESESIKAVVPVDVARNFISDVAPPSSVAGMYPTSSELTAILAQMTAQAKRAEDAVEATEKAQEAVAEYVDNTFPTKVTEAEETLENATTEGVQAVTDKANQAIGAITSHTSTIVTTLDSKKTQIEASIDTKAQAVNSALDGKVTEANDAKNDAVKAKDAAETAKGQAEGFAKDASASASNASTSATQAKTSEDNAKASAVQAENATALKVDQRINTADDSEFPLVVMVDKDVYKFLAPKGATNSSSCRYCCDGAAHYFGYTPYSKGKIYVYDQSLKFIKAINVTLGQKFYASSYQVYDFCTMIGDNFFVRSCPYPYTLEYVAKYSGTGEKLASISIPANSSYIRIFRNERTNNLIVATLFTDEITDDGGTVSTVKRLGYYIYDENLVLLGERRIDCAVSSIWLQHLNVVGNTTLVTYAPTDATKTSLYYLDENDDLIAVAGTVIRGSGAFTSADLTATGRTSANYFLPRMFYDQRFYKDGQHTINLTNGAQWFRVFLNADKSVAIATASSQNPFIKNASLPQAKYDAFVLFYSNGSGPSNGDAAHSQPIVALTSSGILTKIAEMYKNPTGFTDFAPDPFANIANFPRAITGNSRLASDTVATTRAYNLYPAGDYGQAGGAIMFTV